jgi:PTH1 family peptidyl-tRNA hydrolase
MQLKQNLPYTVAFSQKTKVIVGLGNPGKKYENTRHNVGFAAVDYYSEKNNFSNWHKGRFDSYTNESIISNNKIILLKPLTYMNLSGDAIQKTLSYYKLSCTDMLVIYDDLTIPLGQIRTRNDGTAGGHNGIKSIIAHIGKEFPRLKIGIKNQLLNDMDQSDFVLAKFTKEEIQNIPNILSEASELINEFIFNGNLPTETRKIDVRR